MDFEHARQIAEQLNAGRSRDDGETPPPYDDAEFPHERFQQLGDLVRNLPGIEANGTQLSLHKVFESDSETSVPIAVHLQAIYERDVTADTWGDLRGLAIRWSSEQGDIVTEHLYITDRAHSTPEEDRETQLTHLERSVHALTAELTPDT